ncbi:hypothetical protein B0H14DRAFT_3143065 [Mycena olivaceomarginata]|nr:hypothetical protein B0H14DRAFT_3143065 [Mycena olivaceomarginata]
MYTPHTVLDRVFGTGHQFSGAGLFDGIDLNSKNAKLSGAGLITRFIASSPYRILIRTALSGVTPSLYHLRHFVTSVIFEKLSLFPNHHIPFIHRVGAGARGRAGGTGSAQDRASAAKRGRWRAIVQAERVRVTDDQSGAGASANESGATHRALRLDGKSSPSAERWNDIADAREEVHEVEYCRGCGQRNTASPRPKRADHTITTPPAATP